MEGKLIFKGLCLLLKRISSVYMLAVILKRSYKKMLYSISIVAYKWKVSYRWMFRRPGERTGLPGRLIVSLTSYPLRFDTLPLTLKCLLTQTVAPDRIILWVAHEDRPALTKDILNLQGSGLEILFCEDLKSYKKIIPTLEVERNAFIVTADDDVYLWATWLKELVCEFSGDYKEVICHRAHAMRLNSRGEPIPYNKWGVNIGINKGSPLNFPTGVGGVMYPPKIFHPDVLNKDLFMESCPKADDVWLYWMVRLNGGVSRKVGAKRAFFVWPGTQQVSLWQENSTDDGNDGQISSMIGRYGFPINIHESNNVSEARV